MALTTTTTTELVGAGEARRQSGVTMRQLDHWGREGILTYAVPAVGSGSNRKFSPLDIARLRAMRRVSEVLGGGSGHRSLFYVVGAHLMRTQRAEALAPGTFVSFWIAEGAWLRVTL